MEIAFIFMGLFVHYIFLCQRQWLIHKKSFNLLLAGSIILFIVGTVFLFIDLRRSHPSSGFFLIIPLVSLLNFKVLHKWFVTRLAREPKDVFNNWESGLYWDRLFSFLF